MIWGPTWRERAKSTGGHPSAIRRPGRHDETGPGREVVLGRCRRVVPALDRALVHRQSGRGPVRRTVGAVHPRGRRLLDGRGQDTMTDLDVLLAVAGLAVTVLVVAGMILITPRGAVDAFDDVTDPQGA